MMQRQLGVAVDYRNAPVAQLAIGVQDRFTIGRYMRICLMPYQNPSPAT